MLFRVKGQNWWLLFSNKGLWNLLINIFLKWSFIDKKVADSLASKSNNDVIIKPWSPSSCLYQKIVVFFNYKSLKESKIDTSHPVTLKMNRKYTISTFPSAKTINLRKFWLPLTTLRWLMCDFFWHYHKCYFPLLQNSHKQ